MIGIIEVDKSDFDFLLQGKLEPEIIERLRKNHFSKRDSFLLELDKNTIEKILDFLGEELTKNGFGEGDEPNDLGIRIENLIDKFSREIYH